MVRREGVKCIMTKLSYDVMTQTQSSPVTYTNARHFSLSKQQIGNEGEVGALLEAVVWQYSSLQGLAQALAETYYILEAQRLDGYGQETFMARVRMWIVCVCMGE